VDRSQFVSRLVVFSKHGDQISLVELSNPDAKPHVYTAWLGLVISLADGRHTIQELISYAGQHYAGGPPDGLAATIESATQRLAETGTVQLSDAPVELPYYLTLPAERLDVPKALELMAEDGYTQEPAEGERLHEPNASERTNSRGLYKEHDH
jgi:hypothetical protein